MPRALYSPFTLQAAVPGDRRAVFFMLDNLEHWHDLANTMPASAEIVLLDSRANALQDMAHYLAGHRGLEVIHLLSHGAPGRIELGALSLCSANLAAQSALLADIGRALQPGGDWLIYGCEVARGGGRARLCRDACAAGPGECGGFTRVDRPCAASGQLGAGNPGRGR